MKPSTVFMFTGTITACAVAVILLAPTYMQCISRPPQPDTHPLSSELRRQIELRCFRQAAHITRNTEWMHAIHACRKELLHAAR